MMADMVPNFYVRRLEFIEMIKE